MSGIEKKKKNLSFRRQIVDGVLEVTELDSNPASTIY